jgi:mannose-1-phosphate guanylyltransferase
MSPDGLSGHSTQPPWAIVLAGGEGRRLRALTRYVCGDDRPKQFAALVGGRSMLRQTLDRIRPRIPLARTVVVTHVRDAEYMTREFARGEAPECLIQPVDRGTAAAILWAAHVIRHREPDAVVVVFPSDHYVDGEPELMGHVLEVAAFVRRRRERLVLIGAIPTGAETQDGWIEPGAPLGGIRGGAVYEITRFCAEPSPVAQLNARLERLAAFADAPDTLEEVGHAFRLAPSASFSGDVLERLPLSLAVSPLRAGVIWMDWGTTEQVVASVRRAGLRPWWLEALGRQTLQLA